MIRVSVSYPRGENDRFDFEYYLKNHMPLVKERLSPLTAEVDAGIPNPFGQPSPNIAIGYMTFDSMEQFVTSFSAAAPELMADIPNYTDIEPVVQISNVIEI